MSKNKNYTAGSLRVLAAGLTNNHELSTEALQTAGQALLDYAEWLEASGRGGSKSVAAINARRTAEASTDPAAIKNRERVAKFRAKERLEKRQFIIKR